MLEEDGRVNWYLDSSLILATSLIYFQNRTTSLIQLSAVLRKIIGSGREELSFV
jgi:hypothetical protein